MFKPDDFRFQCHHHLIELDAATNRLMMLVVANDLSGARWDESANHLKLAYSAWATLLDSSLSTDPLPALDARPAGTVDTTPQS